MRAFALLAGLLVAADDFAVERGEGAVVVKTAAGKEALRYQLVKPPGSKLSVESACYFHPLATPKGVAVTDAAPDDHKHHRGVFLAWVEMHGKKDADFWGWGQHAPKDKRVIANKEIADVRGGRFRAVNEWAAEGAALVREELEAAISARPDAHVLDLTYTLTADEDLSLSQWAFSGFCVRTRKDGKLEAHNPEGPVKLPAPKHTDPKSNWPAQPWYGYTIVLKDGTVVGAAVIDHPKNPAATWHNAMSIGMLNPSIVAPGKVTLKAKEPLVLRYRVVAHDGPTPRALLNELAAEFRK